MCTSPTFHLKDAPEVQKLSNLTNNHERKAHNKNIKITPKEKTIFQSIAILFSNAYCLITKKECESLL